jgi:sterol desaturase/sphingolipid hydroxylase (fatty acid hydroxylase superfamily)
MEKFIHWLLTDSETAQYWLFFSLLFFLILLEYLLPKRRVVRKKRWIANFALTFINIMALGALPVTFISAAQYASLHKLGIFNWLSLPTTLLIFLTLLLRGFISFFTHYLYHKFGFLWNIHRVHHLDTELDISTNVRFHPLEFVFNIIIGVPLILLFGLSPWILLFYELIDITVTLISHANISFPRKIERLLRYVIVTPDLHRIHHSSYQQETDSNFGAVFPVWDIIFGTFKTKTTVAPELMELGLKEVRDHRTNNIIWLLISPFKKLKQGPEKKDISDR